jgi:hypothetical protein
LYYLLRAITGITGTIIMIACVMGTHTPSRLVRNRAAHDLTRPETTATALGAIGAGSQVNKIATSTGQARGELWQRVANIGIYIERVRGSVWWIEQVSGH